LLVFIIKQASFLSHYRDDKCTCLAACCIRSSSHVLYHHFIIALLSRLG